MNETTQAFSSQAMLGTAVSVSNQRASAATEVQKLDDLAQIDSRALFICKTVFPFDLFPDTITIDRNKITVAKSFFFFTRSVQSIVLTDLLTIVIEESVMFATMRILDRMFPQDTIAVRFLRKSDARKMRWMLEGLIIGAKQKIDFAKVPNDQLIPKLEEIGKTKTL